MRWQLCRVVLVAVVTMAMVACEGQSSPPVAPTVTLTSSASDAAVSSGPPVTLSWSSTHATSCTASGAWSGSVGHSGSQSVAVPQTSVYTISCSGRGGVATASVTIHAWVPPSVSLTADRTSVLPNETVLLTWSSQNATECSGFAGLPGSMPSLPTSGSQVTAPLTQATRFLVICGNPVFRAGMAEVVVEVAPPKFSAFALPMDSAIDLNDAGDVVGQRRSAGDSIDAVAWIAGANVGAVLGCFDPPYCYNNYSPAAMNSVRTVIGLKRARVGMSYGAFRWYVGVGEDPSISIFSPTTVTDINDAGQIVGGSLYGPGAMLFSDGTVVLLFGSSGSVSMASAINNAGHITGYSVPGADQTRHVFLYADGAVQDLGTLDGFSSFAQDINESDEIIGSAETPVGSRAFLYSNSRFTDLGSLGGASSWATGINDAGQVVGTSTLAGADPQARRAFIYVNGAMFDLNEFVEALPVPLTEAREINNRGKIIANACAPPDYVTDCRAYLLTPLSFP